MRTALIVLRKDLLLELRGFETLPTMVLFSIATRNGIMGVIGPALAAQDFRESALYDPDYRRRFREGAAS